MPLRAVSPVQARRLGSGGAQPVDMRESDEHAREHIPGALNIPLSRLDELEPGPVVFHCRSGMRTESHAAELAAAAKDQACHILTGGIDAWRAAGLPTRVDRSQPIDIMRQVQIVAGSLVLTGVALGVFVAPAFFGLSAFVGAGLIMAGTTGWCGMAKLLRFLPWNRKAQRA